MENVRLIAGKEFKVLYPQDYTCQKCNVEVTNSLDHVCELCKAIGKTCEPIEKTTFWEDIQYGIQSARDSIFGLRH